MKIAPSARLSVRLSSPSGVGGASASAASQWKEPVRCATTAAITLATGLENGDTIDGVTLATGDRVLVKDQASGAENGIYEVQASGAPERTPDFDAPAEAMGAWVYVIDGTTNGATVWYNTNTSLPVIDTDALTFVQFSGGGGGALDDLTDVTAPTPSDGDVLTFDNGTGEWVNSPPAGGSLALDDLTDVSTAGEADGEHLVYDGSGWVSEPVYRTVLAVIDGFGSVLSTGVKGDIGPFDFAGVIEAVTLLADQSGSVVVDIWKDTYANYPPTDADSITASAPPTISSATKSQDTTLTGWTTAISAGDTLRFNVDSATTVTRVEVALKVRLT